MLLSAFIDGALLGGALIIAIGAQNLFVLRQGIAKDQVFAVVLLCSVIDGVLIIAGALGLGSLIAAFPLVVPVATIGGALFLIVFGGMAFYRALFTVHVAFNVDGGVTSSLKKAVLMTLAFGFLNPHVYLDTVIMLGGIAARFEMQSRLYFMAGAVMMSFVWFFSLGYGARLLSPFMRHPLGARVLDIIVGCVMYLVAARLLWDMLQQTDL
jgi:L-lysine exporter family protein LysE/ArgO